MKASIDFAVRIPPILSLRTLWARATIDVPAASSGPLVAVADAISFEVRSNLKSYGLRFEITDPEVVAVEVDGLGQPVTVRREGLTLLFPAIASADRTLRRSLVYRVIFSPGAHPGPRPMPMVFSLQGE